MIKIKTKTSEYFSFYLENIFKFTANRFFPYISMGLIGILIANKNMEEFAFFSYVASAFIFPSTIATFMFMAIGNLDSKNKNRGADEVFISSLVMAFIAAGLVGFACLLIIFSSKEELNVLPLSYNAVSFEYTYLSYIIIYIFNSFFNCFFESHIKDGTSSIARLLNFTPLMFSSLYVFFKLPSENSSLIMVQLMLGCSAVELVYYCYKSRKIVVRGAKFQPLLFKQLFILGAPTGIGLALQRFAFFIVNKKLFLLNKDLVSIFSIAISIVSLMAIPVSAFTQIHSIYVTRKSKIGLSLDAFGLLVMSMFLPLIVFLGFGKSVLLLFGISHKMLADHPYLIESVTSIFLVTGLLMLVSSHIRALGNTLVPQLVINITVYSVYVGSVLYGGLDGRSASFLLATYSVTYFICFLLLALYVVHIERKPINAPWPLV